tara:strand:+ start:732 stop:1547 length:816 start_codon:yes stop_codon:yes gene_type:complete
MARNYIPLSDVINDFIIGMDGNDYAAHAGDAVIRNFALRGLREMGFDMLKVIRSLKLEVSNNTATLPDDYVDWSKVGVVGTDGLVYVLSENKNINISQKYSKINGSVYDSDGDGLNEREDDKTSTGTKASSDSISDGFDSSLFRNYVYNGEVGRLYGIGGGNYEGEFRVNLDQNRLEIKSNSDVSELVMEYVADEARSSNPQVHVYAEEALNSYIYYRLIERKAAVPANEKQRARAEYYNERRKANARMKSFTKEEALKTIRKNYKQAPKG